jgi:hypothetical protein
MGHDPVPPLLLVQGPPGLVWRKERKRWSREMAPKIIRNMTHRLTQTRRAARWKIGCGMY